MLGVYIHKLHPDPLLRTPFRGLEGDVTVLAPGARDRFVLQHLQPADQLGARRHDDVRRRSGPQIDSVHLDNCIASKR